MIELELRNDAAALKDFCDHEFWESKKNKPSPDDPGRLLHYLCTFVCGPDGNGPKDASFYKTALEALLVDGVPRDKIADEIVNRGGLRAIVDAYREQNREEQSTAQEAEGGSPNSKTAKGAASSKGSGDDLSAAEASPRAKTILTIREGDPILAVETEMCHMGEIMSTHLGGKATLLIKRVADEKNGLKRFRLLTIMDD